MPAPHVDFRCEGCGSLVALLGLNRRPAHRFCIVCAFLCTHVPDPAELVELRRRIVRDLAAD
jgi:hypothetical protein